MGTAPETSSPVMVGVDLGGTYARAGLVDTEGTIVASFKELLVERSPAGVVEAIAASVRKALTAFPGAVVGACGVGVAAQLDGTTGHVAVAPNLGWRDVPFGPMLGRRLGRPVLVVNDLVAAAWGELRAGAARGQRDVWVVFVGSGVGSAIISDGRLVRGARGVAGELGHTKVVPHGRPCGCGERGCLEAYAGGHNLIAQMKEAIASGRPTSLARLAEDPVRLNPAELELAAAEGDPVASEIYERAGGHLGLAIANQVTMLNPAYLILGGGVLSHCPGMQDRITRMVGEYASMVSRQSLRISRAALGDDSGLIGAALLAAEAATSR